MNTIKYTALLILFLNAIISANLSQKFDEILGQKNYYHFILNDDNKPQMPAIIRIVRTKNNKKTIYTAWIKNNAKIKRKNNADLISLIEQLQNDDLIAKELHKNQNLIKYIFTVENNETQNEIINNQSESVVTSSKPSFMQQTQTSKNKKQFAENPNKKSGASIEPRKVASKVIRYKKAGDIRREK